MATRFAQPVRRYVGAVARLVRDPLAFLPDRGRPPTDSPRVGLVGFYGSGNYGDDLFLEAFQEHLRAPIRLHTVLDPKRAAASQSALQREVRRSDVLVIGGGDLVIPWRMSRYWRRVFLERPVFVAGVGVPAWEAPVPDVVERLRGFFRHPSVRGIAARDAESAAWIRDALQPAVPVQESPDLACSLSLPDAQRPPGPPIFGVAVRRRDTVDDLTHVQRLCRRAMELGYRVRRIVLATGPLLQADLEVTRQLGLDDAELVASDDLGEISRAIGECSMLASMKFHGVVVATMYRVPAIVLMPSAKTLRFVNRIGRPELISVFSSPDLPDLVSRDPEPLPATLPEELRRGAVAYLAQLRASILETAAAGSSARG